MYIQLAVQRQTYYEYIQAKYIHTYEFNTTGTATGTATADTVHGSASSVIILLLLFESRCSCHIALSPCRFPSLTMINLRKGATG